MSVVLATAGFDHKIRFWEAPSGICSRIIKFPDSQVNRLEITPDKQFIAAAGNPAIRLYEIKVSSATNSANQGGASAVITGGKAGDQSQQACLNLEGHTSNVTSIGFQKDGRYLYSGSEDGTIKVWDLRSPKYSRSFDSEAGVNSVTLRTDRDEIISGDQNGYVKIWDLGGKGCINSLKPSAAGNSSHGGESNVNGNSVRKKRHHFSESAVPIQAVDISEDSRTLVAISNHGTVFVWDPSISGVAQAATDENADRKLDPPLVGASLLRPVARFRANAPGTYCLFGKIAPDCRHLVTTGSDGMAKLWDTTTWELAQTLQNQKWVYSAAFCADSSYLVTASSDSVARLWNLRSGDVVRQYHGHQSSVTCVALNDSSV